MTDVIQRCEVCGTEYRLGELTIAGEVTITLCVWCHEDEPRFQRWLEGELEATLEADPNYEKIGDGKWRRASGL